MLLLLEFRVMLANTKEPQIAIDWENLVYQINGIFAICGEIDFNRYFGLLPLVRQGFKPLSHSESPLKRTEYSIIYDVFSRF